MLNEVLADSGITREQYMRYRTPLLRRALVLSYWYELGCITIDEKFSLEVEAIYQNYQREKAAQAAKD